MILFDLDEDSVTMDWDEVCGMISVSQNETIRNAIKCAMSNSLWNIRSITSNDSTHHILIKWISDNGHKGITVIATNEENCLNVMKSELIKECGKAATDELVELMVMPYSY